MSSDIEAERDRLAAELTQLKRWQNTAIPQMEWVGEENMRLEGELEALRAENARLRAQLTDAIDEGRVEEEIAL